MGNMGSLVKQDYLEKVFHRLESEGFKIAGRLNYGYHHFEHVAKRTKFEFDKFGFAQTYFVFDECQGSDLFALRKFSKACIEYGINSSKVPLPRGFGKSVVCYSVALVNGIDPAVAQSIQSDEPQKRFAALEISVVCDTSSGKLYYLETTPNWGRLYWDHLRETIRRILTP